MAKDTGKGMRLRMILVMLFMTLVCMGVLIYRLSVLQITGGQEYQQRAVAQQMRSVSINANRGTIYDRNGKELATSATVWNVILVPAYIEDEEVEPIAAGLAEILGKEKDEIAARCANKERYYELVGNKVEEETAQKVLALAEQLGTKGITLEEDTKRYYPYGDLAAQVLGFTGSENKGAYGIEAYYEETLAGTPGRKVSAQNAMGTDLDFQYKELYEAKEGNSLVLTIDETIQHYLEKHLETAVIEHNVKNGAAGIIMDANTCEVLAMATAPDFDPNKPLELGDPNKQAQLELLEEDSEEYNEFLRQAQYDQWRNKVISDPYEPGSVFKIVTAATALENGVASLNDTFECTGSTTVSGNRFGCWKAAGHGVQTFTQAIENSCNPAFIAIGARIGGADFYEAFERYGLAEPTGIDLPGEADNAGLVQSYTNLTKEGGVELASTSFGQTFKVSALQLCTAVCASVNGGTLYQPYIVKQVLDPEGNVISTTQPEAKRQVISEETSETIRYLTEMVVKEGSGRNATIPGYRIGGKTGTSEKIDLLIQTGRDENILSFVGIAPADDPQIVCLIMLDEPTLENAFGSTIAAPVVGAVLSEVLPYLGIDPEYSDEELANMDITVGNYVGMVPHDAQAALTQKTLKARIIGDGGTVIAQVPSSGEDIPRGGTVVLYTDQLSQEDTVVVPGVIGMSGAEANRTIVNAGLNIKVKGVDTELPGAVAVRQSPAEGESVPPGTIITVDFLDLTTDG
ncbi:MAG: PASTA domain-containing protein [Oscillospiraceae bacterium]|nr:PASTA domain-containing protein [Oscillospiraceae bacterium]